MKAYCFEVLLPYLLGVGLVMLLLAGGLWVLEEFGGIAFLLCVLGLGLCGFSFFWWADGKETQ